MKRRRLLILVLIICLAVSQLLGTVVYAVVESRSQISSESSNSIESASSLDSVEQTLPWNGTSTERTDSSTFSDVSSQEKNQSEDRLAEGKFGTSPWYISSDFTLVIQAGELADTEEESPWVAYKDKIQKILIEEEVTLGKESSHLFQDLFKLVEIDSIENLKFSEPTKVNDFFRGCLDLKELDFSNWDTKEIIENDDFLNGCEKLETIKLGTNSVFKTYEDEKLQEQQEQPAFIWKGKTSEKVFPSIPELLSKNEGIADVYSKETAPEESEIIVKYLDENEKEIHDNKKLTGTIGESYDLENEEYQLKIDGYVIDDTKLPGTKGIFQEASLTLIFHYKKVAARAKRADETPSVLYRSHVESIGWQPYVKDGQQSGTSGQKKRLEGVQIRIENNSLDGGIQYRTHIQDIGWESSFKSNNAISGTTGKAKRLEAIQIKLTGEIAKHYDVYYRVHIQNFGWLDWAKNGGSAGTEGLAFRLESLQIRLIKKGSDVPTNSSRPFVKRPTISYRSHVESIGWQKYVKDGQKTGTSGQKKRLEAIQVRIENSGLSGSVQYRTHIQDFGWESSFRSNNGISGTTGKKKRLEAIQIRLTGDIAKYFDVYYRAHPQSLGWLSWAKNGESAGTEGMACRMEGLEIRLVPKGSNQLTSNPKAFVRAPTVSYRTHVQNIGWQNYAKNGQTSGTSGQKKRLEAIQIRTENSTLTGGIQYRTHIQNIGWESSSRYNNAVSGTFGQAKRLEAIQIQLNGEVAKHFDVYYRAHAQNFGWLGWAKNGMNAGTEAYGYRLEAIQIKLVPKWRKAPSPTSNAYKKKPMKPTLSTFLGTTKNRILNELLRHQNDWYYLTTPFVGTLGNNASVMSPKGNPTSYGPGMNCTGFIATVTRNGGANLSNITRRSNRYGGPCNGFNWRDALVPVVQYHSYPTVSDLLRGGKATKGDLIYFEADYSRPNPDCHLGFFWGNYPSHDRLWHQPFPSNRISHMYSGTPYSKVILFKL